MKLICLILIFIFAQSLFAQRITYRTFQSWNSLDWKNVYKESYSYFQGIKDSVYIRDWNKVTEKFENSILILNNMGTNGEILSSTNFQWNTSISDWKEFSKRNFFYNQNLLDSLVIMTWKNNSWINQEKQEIAYMNEKALLRESWQWNFSASKWDPLSQIEYQYKNGLLDTEITSNWDIFQGSFSYVYKEEYSYTVFDSTSAIIYYINSGGNWEIRSRQKNTYNSKNQLTISKDQYFQNTDSTWHERFMHIISYKNDHIDSVVSKIYNETKLEYENYGRILYSYENFQGTRKLEHNFNFSISPNPAHNYLIVNVENKQNRIAEIEVLNLYGRTLINEQVKHSGRYIFDISSFDNGVYFIRVHVKEGALSAKFIVK